MMESTASPESEPTLGEELKELLVTVERTVPITSLSEKEVDDFNNGTDTSIEIDKGEGKGKLKVASLMLLQGYDNGFAPIYDLEDVHAALFEALGLRVRLIIVKSVGEPAKKIECVPVIESEKNGLASFLRDGFSQNYDHDLEENLVRFANRIYHQVCRVYNLENPDEKTREFLAEVPHIYSEFERIMIDPNQTLKACAEAITGEYLREYKLLENNNLLPENFFLEDDLEAEFKKIEKVFVKAKENQKAEDFVSRTSLVLEQLVRTEISELQRGGKEGDVGKIKVMEQIADFLHDIDL